jgi:hypothetical protein
MQRPVRIAIWINGTIARNAAGLTARDHASCQTIIRRVTHQPAHQEER